MFCDRYYKNGPERFQASFIVCQQLDESGPNFFDKYEVRVGKSQQVIVDRLLKLKRDM